MVEPRAQSLNQIQRRAAVAVMNICQGTGGKLQVLKRRLARVSGGVPADIWRAARRQGAGKMGRGPHAPQCCPRCSRARGNVRCLSGTTNLIYCESRKQPSSMAKEIRRRVSWTVGQCCGSAFYLEQHSVPSQNQPRKRGAC